MKRGVFDAFGQLSESKPWRPSEKPCASLENAKPREEMPVDELDELDKRVSAALAKRASSKTGGEGQGGANSGPGIAARIGVEMVSALVIGVLIGVSLDKWLNTAPWFLIAFLFMGAAAGFLNVYRTASGYGLAIGYKPQGDKEAGLKKPAAKDQKAD